MVIFMEAVMSSCTTCRQVKPNLSLLILMAFRQTISQGDSCLFLLMADMLHFYLMPPIWFRLAVVILSRKFIDTICSQDPMFRSLLIPTDIGATTVPPLVRSLPMGDMSRFPQIPQIWFRVIPTAHLMHLCTICKPVLQPEFRLIRWVNKDMVIQHLCSFQPTIGMWRLLRMLAI